MGKSDPKWSRHFRHHERYLGHQGYLAMSMEAKGAYDLLCHLAGQAWGEDRRAGGTMSIGATRRVSRKDAARWLGTKGVSPSKARALVNEIYGAGLAEDAKQDGAMVLTEWIDHQESKTYAAVRKRKQRAEGKKNQGKSAARRGGDATIDGAGGYACDMSRDMSQDMSQDASRDRSRKSKSKNRDVSLSNRKDSSGECTPPPVPAAGPPSTSTSTFDRDPSRNPNHHPVTGHANGSEMESAGAEAPSTSIRRGGPAAGTGARGVDPWAPGDPVEIACTLTHQHTARAKNTLQKALRELGEQQFRCALDEVRTSRLEGFAPNPGKLLNYVIRRIREKGA